MFSDPFNLYRDVASGSEITDAWNRISLNGNSAVYMKTNIAADHPKYLRISHTTVGSGQAKRDRHLVKFELPQVVDSVETGLFASVYVVADIPQVGISSTQTGNLYRFLVGLLRMDSAEAAYGAQPALFWDKFLRGEA